MPNDEQILAATEDLFLLESEIHTTMFDAPAVQAEIRRVGIKGACPVLHRAIKTTSNRLSDRFRPVLIEHAKAVIPASQLADADAWGLYSYPISPYRERLRYFVDRDADALITEAIADTTNSFLDEVRALPSISKEELRADPRTRDMTLGVQFAGVCKTEMIGKQDEVKSARALKEQLR